MTDILHNRELKKLEGETLLELFELDISPIYENNDAYFQASYCFHNYPIRPEDSNAQTSEGKGYGVIVYEGKNFFPFPYIVDGFDVISDDALPRPTIKIANIHPLIRNLSTITSGLVGAHIYRYRVFYKYLDNMPESESVTASFPRDMFIILRKKSETKFMIEFELVTPLEHGNIQMPRRQILTHTCTFNYRGDGCGYSGYKIINIKNKYYGSIGNGTLSQEKIWEPDTEYKVNDIVKTIVKGRTSYHICIKDHTSNYSNKFHREYWDTDECSRCLLACKMRFGTDAVLPFGGFPNASIG